MGEDRLMIIFNQFVPKWKNEADGETYMVVSYLNVGEMEVRKTFINRREYVQKNIKGMFTIDLNNVKILKGTFETDEADHERIAEIKVEKVGKLEL